MRARAARGGWKATIRRCRGSAAGARHRQHVAAWRNMLQRGATCCSVAQHVAAWRNMLQRCATSCSATPTRRRAWRRSAASGRPPQVIARAEWHYGSLVPLEQKVRERTDRGGESPGLPSCDVAAFVGGRAAIRLLHAACWLPCIACGASPRAVRRYLQCQTCAGVRQEGAARRAPARPS
jgi:hypothetical protein